MRQLCLILADHCLGSLGVTFPGDVCCYIFECKSSLLGGYTEAVPVDVSTSNSSLIKLQQYWVSGSKLVFKFILSKCEMKSLRLCGLTGPGDVCCYIFECKRLNSLLGGCTHKRVRKIRPVNVSTSNSSSIQLCSIASTILGFQIETKF